MENLTQGELIILEEIVNNELNDYLQSGYELTNEYVINLRNILKKLNLKEFYDYDKIFA